VTIYELDQEQKFKKEVRIPLRDILLFCLDTKK